MRQLESAAKREQPAGAPPAAADPAMQALQTRLSDLVGNTVRIDYDADRRRGELRIAFHDLDEFDGLLARLGYEPD